MTQSFQDSWTATFENNPLAVNGTNNGFYFDNNINIGFGYNITGNLGSAQAALAAVGITFTPDQWTIVKAYASQPSINSANQLNNQLGTTISQSQAYQLEDNYIQSIIPDLEDEIAGYSSLPSLTQVALVDLQYETNGTFLGPKTISALQSGDFATAAFELAVDLYNPNSSNGPLYRCMADAMLVLGLIPTVERNFTIGLLNGQTSTSNATVAKFLDELATTASTSHGTIQAFQATPYGSAMYAALAAYTIQQGFYIVQPTDVNASGGAAESIAAQVNVFGLSIDAATLTRINGAFADSLNFAAGGLIHVPTSADPVSVSSSPYILPPLIGNQAYVYDSVSSKLYTVGASPDGSYVDQFISLSG